MSDIVDAIEASFKELVKTKPFRSVSVKDICAHAHISRNTFYTHFRDKRAIVAYIFKRDAIEPIQRVLDLLTYEEIAKVAPSVCELVYQAIYDEREYYTDLIVPMCGVDSTFELVVGRAIYDLLVNAVELPLFAGDEQELKYAAYYQSAGQAILIEKWVADRFKVPVDRMATLHASMIRDFWAKRTETPVPDGDLPLKRPPAKGLLR